MNWIALTFCNVLLWPMVHLTVSWWALRLDVQKFNIDSFLFKERFFELSGDLYEKAFCIKKWKRKLPDGAGMLGVKIDKSAKALMSPEGRKKLLAETMRSEWAHWVTACLGLVLASYNTFEVWLVMLAYALLSNGPCILAQRYNRIKLKKLF